MNVAIAAMIAGRLRRRRRDHAVTRIHDSSLISSCFGAIVLIVGNCSFAMTRATTALVLPLPLPRLGSLLLVLQMWQEEE